MAIIIGSGGGDGEKSHKLGVRRPSLVGTTYEYLEVRWIEESISGREVLVSGRGRLVLTISYARLGQGGWRTLLVVEVEAKS